MAPSFASHAPERSKVEQIVVEYFAKSLHIILEARIPALGGEYLGSSASSSTTSGPKTRDRWFNLALGDCTTALENFEPWRRSLSDPMVVDIVLDHSDRAKGGSPSAQGSFTSTTQATVLERWTVQFEQGRSSSSSPVPRGPDEPGVDEAQEPRTFVKEWSRLRSPKARMDLGQSAGKGGLILPAHITEVSAVYKRTVIMLRSLYSTCRLLPAYRMFRISSSPTNCCDFTLNYRVLSSASPLSEHDKRDMLVYGFSPVETAFGRMCLSVAYRFTTSVIALEVVPSILPRIIPDYVGSPTTDPLKRFTGDPHSLPITGRQISQGIRMVSVPSSLQNSPAEFDLRRRHSWSDRVHQGKPALQPPSSPSYRISSSPSPLFHRSPPYPPPFSPFSQKHPSSDVSFSPLSSPLSSADRPLVISAKVNVNASKPISIDNRCSPSFSPSPSPSPPTSYRGSDPVSIPKCSHSRGSKVLTGDVHQRSRNLLPPLSPSSNKQGVLQRSSSESPSYAGQAVSHAHQSRSFESPMPPEFHDDRTQQVWMNEQAGPLSTENLLYAQLQTNVSRSSSRTALADEGEDEDFACPFAVDDVDAEEKRISRSGSSGLMREVPESSRSPQQLSQDAAVGALILILKSALPLGRTAYPGVEAPFGALNERESVLDRIPASLAGVGRGRHQSSPLSATKTVAKALEALRYYKELVHTRKEEVGGGASSGKDTLSG